MSKKERLLREHIETLQRENDSIESVLNNLSDGQIPTDDDRKAVEHARVACTKLDVDLFELAYLPLCDPARWLSLMVAFVIAGATGAMSTRLALGLDHVGDVQGIAVKLAAIVVTALALSFALRIGSKDETIKAVAADMRAVAKVTYGSARRLKELLDEGEPTREEIAEIRGSVKTAKKLIDESTSRL